MPELSIIMPFVNEYPQNVFTVQNVMCELEGRVDYEIIAINNWIPNSSCGKEQDKGYKFLKNVARGHGPKLKVLHYDKKLSHWCAKNLGIVHSTAPYLFFCDSHCIIGRDCLFDMFMYYKENEEELHGSLHLPISYMMERPGMELIYKPKFNLEKGALHYSFSRYRRPEDGKPYKVPCMSTCGMLMSRKIVVDELQMWPEELGIYGGGENFINYSLAVMGYNVNIFPKPAIYHYAEKRGYSWNYNDWLRNRIIALYLPCGREITQRLVDNARGHQHVKQGMLDEISVKCNPQREHIKKRTCVDIYEWVERWKNF